MFRKWHDAIMDGLWRSLILVLAVWGSIVFVLILLRLYPPGWE